tara:strand:- start:93 stop:476 length:384 start_codon:yes stop_codon:yes gene_type:complete
MKKPIMKKEDLHKEYFKVRIKLNDIYKIYRSDFEGMIEVAEQEVMAKFPKTDWRQIKLLVMQTMINHLAVKLVQHFSIHKDKDQTVDGDKLLMDWTEVMSSALSTGKVHSEINEMLGHADKEGHTIQ